ncbi:hypothetical protein BH10ACT6_BH10ACT6_08830 [soil metagenome]
MVASLTAAGITIAAVPANRQYVVFRGTAAQLGAAFATTLVAPSRVPSRPDLIKQGDIPSDTTGVQTFGRQAAASAESSRGHWRRASAPRPTSRRSPIRTPGS